MVSRRPHVAENVRPVAFMVAVAFLAGASSIASAICIWERDGIEDESRHAPAVADLLQSRFVRTLPEVWEFRLHRLAQAHGFDPGPPGDLPVAEVFAKLQNDRDTMDALTLYLTGAGRYEDAERLLQRGHEAWPARFATHANLGSLLLSTERFQEAQEALATALANAPEGVELADRLVLVLLHELAGFWATHAAGEPNNGNLLHLDFDSLISSDWRMRPETDRRPQDRSPLLFRDLAPSLATPALVERLRPWLADAADEVTFPMLRDALAQVGYQFGDDHYWMAPVFELLGDTCAVLMDRVLAFQAYVLARRLYADLRPEHPRAEWCRVAINQVATAGAHNAAEAYDESRFDLLRQSGRQQQAHREAFQRRCIARGLDPAAAEVVPLLERPWRPNRVNLEVFLYLVLVFAGVLLVVIWFPPERWTGDSRRSA